MPASSLRLRPALLFGVLLALGLPTQAPQNPIDFSRGHTDGVAVEYHIDTQPFGGMYTANYHLDNANAFPVEVRFTIKYALQDGRTATLDKGPIRVRAGDTTRTGWAGEGDVWERKEGGYPLRGEIAEWTVTRDD